MSDEKKPEETETNKAERLSGGLGRMPLRCRCGFHEWGLWKYSETKLINTGVIIDRKQTRECALCNYIESRCI